MEIREGDLSNPAVIALLGEHLQNMAEVTPPESIHALGLEALRKPEITFWSAWEGDALLGCGAMKELDARHGEIKSMRTASLHLRNGVATRLMDHILEVARGRSYERLSLETGSGEAFASARSLYVRFGFRSCGPFADYGDDPNSAYFTRDV